MSDPIAQIADAMQTVLQQDPEDQARPTGFLKRQRNLTASVFVKALVFGFPAGPDAGLDDLTRIAAAGESRPRPGGRTGTGRTS